MNRKNSGAETNVLQICLDIAVLAGAFAVEYFIFFNKISKTEALYCLTMVEAFAVIYILSNKEARIYNVTLFFYLDRLPDHNKILGSGCRYNSHGFVCL